VGPAGRVAGAVSTGTGGPVVTRIGPGVYRVEIDGRAEIVYVAGPVDDRWLHWNGQVFRRPFHDARTVRHQHAHDGHQSLSSPMPATVRKVLVEPGAHVRKGDTLIVLEAMKMELPIRAGADGTVRSVHCQEDELVQPGAVLVELE
jgi:acetyl/propionyl-CoA carboxylase alpha subunit